jgi:lipopolysaccharide/colanic/teichoic acid biosynthesis glycosyltransferase
VTWSKRIFDILFAVTISTVLGPVLVFLALAVLVIDGRPVFYVSERMKDVDQGFALWKLRTMRHVKNDGGVTGGDKANRLTRTGRILRKTRADELPQLWNVMRGDISFVGPRPPLRQYVESFPALYCDVLRSRPGITGLATLIYHRHKEMLISRCNTSAETDAVYQRRCVQMKARLDLIYQKHASFCFDLQLIWQTAILILMRGSNKSS